MPPEVQKQTITEGVTPDKEIIVEPTVSTTGGLRSCKHPKKNGSN